MVLTVGEALELELGELESDRVAVVVDLGVGGDWELFGCVDSGFEVESEHAIREWRGLVLSMSLYQFGV